MYSQKQINSYKFACSYAVVLCSNLKCIMAFFVLLVWNLISSWCIDVDTLGMQRCIKIQTKSEQT